MSDTTATLRPRGIDPLSGLPLRRDDRPALTPEAQDLQEYQRRLSAHTNSVMGVRWAPTPEMLAARAVDALAACSPVHVCRHLGMAMEREADRQRFLVDPQCATLRNAARVVMRQACDARPDLAQHVRAMLDNAEDPAPIEGAIRIISPSVGYSPDRIRLRDSFLAYINASGLPALCAERERIEHAPQDVQRRLQWRADRLKRLQATRAKAADRVKARLADGSKAIGGPDGLADALVLARRLRGVPNLAQAQRDQLAAAEARLAQTERDLAAVEGYECPPELLAGLQKTAEDLRGQITALKAEIKNVERADALATAAAAFAGDLPSFTAVLNEVAAMPGAFSSASRQAILDADWYPDLGVDVVIDAAESDEGLQYTPRG